MQLPTSHMVRDSRAGQTQSVPPLWDRWVTLAPEKQRRVSVYYVHVTERPALVCPAGAASPTSRRPLLPSRPLLQRHGRAHRPPGRCEAQPRPGPLAEGSDQTPPIKEICQRQLIPCGLSVSPSLFCLRPGVGGESGPERWPLTRARDSSVPGPLRPDPGSGSSAVKRPVSRRRAAR